MTPALALVLTLAAQAAAPVTVEQLTAPEKALRFEVTVPAPLDEVWDAFTTRDGLQAWLWKDCRVDLRPGGDWIVQYTPTATGGGTIVSFEPRREIVIRALAPEQFPTVRKVRTNATFRFEAAGLKATRVTLLQTGWQAGEEWDAAYAYLAKGNAQLLTQLQRRFVSGPIDWSRYQ
jgi:uncharacterized protein YndB with AHSA1/START domain